MSCALNLDLQGFRVRLIHRAARFGVPPAVLARHFGKQPATKPHLAPSNRVLADHARYPIAFLFHTKNKQKVMLSAL